LFFKESKNRKIILNADFLRIDSRFFKENEQGEEKTLFWDRWVFIDVL
jgi:hypothetical protein